MSYLARTLPVLVVSVLLQGRPAAPPPLRVIEFPSPDSQAFHVNSALILGPTEAILVDAQVHRSDAERVADRIAATGTHLKAIFITHPDEDHYLGAATFVERFPGTKVYMTPAAIEEFRKTSAKFLDGIRKQAPQEAPDSLVTPQPLSSDGFTVDGQDVKVVPDLQGDVLVPSNSFLWIPSLRTVITGDIVFNHVHPWLAASDVESRKRWHQSIARIAALHPAVVIAGHKSSQDTPDSPSVLKAMDQYLTDFDAVRETSVNADSMVATMKRKYPDWTVQGLLWYSAHMAKGEHPPG